jgi:vacuolar iron transporter family protein
MTIRRALAEQHPHPSLLSDFILGSQDGLVNILGIVLGLTAAAADLRILLIAAFAALGAESISMAAVAYTSTNARRRFYLSEEARERREMQDVPQMERAEVREVFEKWGYAGTELDDLTDRICEKPSAMLEFMMAFELKLAPVAEDAPLKSAYLVGTATILGSIIPLVPFLVVGANTSLSVIIAVVLSGVTLFSIGWYQARTTVGSLWRSGLQMLLIGLGAGLAGFLIGHFLGTA